MNADKMSLSGLKTALRRYDANGCRIIRQGDWIIGRGGYDMAWELSYYSLFKTRQNPRTPCNATNGFIR